MVKDVNQMEKELQRMVTSIGANSFTWYSYARISELDAFAFYGLCADILCVYMFVFRTLNYRNFSLIISGIMKIGGTYK